MKRLIWLAVLCFSASAYGAQAGARLDTLTAVPAGDKPRKQITATVHEGSYFLRGDVLAQVLGGTFSWVGELGKFVLTVDGHSIEVVDQSEFAVVDRDTILPLPAPAFLWQGRMLVPLDIAVNRDGSPRPWMPDAVSFDSEDGVLRASTRAQPTLIEVQVIQDALGWKLSMVADQPFTPQLIRAERASMVLRLRDVVYDPATLTVPEEHSWFQGLRFRPGPRGVEVAFSAGVLPRGYRLIESHDGKTAEILMGVDERDIRTGDLTPFATSTSKGDMRLTRLVLDPGHDAAAPGGDVAYALCLALAEELSASLNLDVLLTHPRDRDPIPETRVARANEASGDLFVSLHVHNRPKGPTVYVGQPPLPVPVNRDLSRLGFRPYYAGQEGHLQVSRAVAQDLMQAVAEALEQAPGGVFTESLPELQGALMPAVLLEIGLGGTSWDESVQRSVVDAMARALRKHYWRSGP